jgi:hypothetical protein
MRAVDLNIRSNINQIQKSLDEFARRQVPYATAIALTALAKEVMAAEQKNLETTFKHPKPFTVKSLGVQAARKNDLHAVVFMRPVAAKYLKPYDTGGLHVLPGKALFNPKDLQLDQYGQLPQRVMQRLKARSDIFIGPIKTKHGVINGVWQKTAPPVQKGKRGPRNTKLLKVNTSGKLKLLIRFGDALPVNKRLNWGAHAGAVINARYVAVFGESLAKAKASAR